jgi:hypothetical protein
MVKLGKMDPGQEHKMIHNEEHEGEPRDYDPPLLSKKEIKEITEKNKKVGRPKKKSYSFD